MDQHDQHLVGGGGISPIVIVVHTAAVFSFHALVNAMSAEFAQRGLGLVIGLGLGPGLVV